MIYHSSFDMEYLGWCMIMGGVWMMGESKLRQILVPNASALGSLCFVMILLCPIPILLYADSIQKRQTPEDGIQSAMKPPVLYTRELSPGTATN